MTGGGSMRDALLCLLTGLVAGLIFCVVMILGWGWL